MYEGFAKHHININGFNVVLHHFSDIDKDDPHDHPFAFTTHILKGGYIEKIYYPFQDGTYFTEIFHRKPGTAHKIEATTIHQIIEFPEGDCWTLMIPEKAEKQPCFWRFDDTGIYSRIWHEKEFKKIY